MDNNIVKDINDLYLNQVVNRELEEAKKPNDGNLANNYPPYDEVTYGDVVTGRLGKDQMGGKRKKITKEGFSNWRDDLSEVISDVQLDTQIKEKKIKNKIKTSAIGSGIQIPEAVKNLGGTLIEMIEIEDFEDVFDDLSESDIFFLTDQLIEEVVEEVFFECIQEGYDILNIENILLESLEISSQILSEAKVTLGHDTKVKSDRLEKVKTAVKNTGKKLVRGAGYLGGLAVRGAKAVGRELSAGYKRGRHGASGSSRSSSDSSRSLSGSDSSRSSGSSSGSNSSGSSSSSSGSSSGSGSSRPGLLGRIGSSLKSGLKRVISKGARKVARGALGVARRMEKENPSAVHSKAGVRSSNPRSGIGGGKRVEVAGSSESKKEQPVQRVSVRDVTPPKPKPESKAPVGTSENPRVGQSAADKPKSEPTVRTRTRTRTVSTKGFGSFKPSSSGEEAYQKEKEKQETAKSAKKAPKAQSKPKPKAQSKPKPADDQDDTDGKLDNLLKSLKKENYQLSEKAESEQQQKIFGLALSVKRGKTPRSKVSAEVLKIVDGMSEKKIRDFAKTSHEGIPKKVQTKEEAIKDVLIDKMTKKIAEQALETQSSQQKSDQQQKKMQQQQDRVKQQEIQILQRKLQALKSSPKGIDPSITA